MALLRLLVVMAAVWGALGYALVQNASVQAEGVSTSIHFKSKPIDLKPIDGHEFDTLRASKGPWQMLDRWQGEPPTVYVAPAPKAAPFYRGPYTFYRSLVI